MEIIGALAGFVGAAYTLGGIVLLGAITLPLVWCAFLWSR